MKMGRIHRCGNCDTKCDDTHSAKYFTNSWGQRTGGGEINYFCCEDCVDYYIREKDRPSFEGAIAYYNKMLPQLMEYLQYSLKRGEKIPCLFETIRYIKLIKRAKEMLLSQEHTYEEVQVAFLKARDVALALSEDLQDEKHKEYFKLEYKVVINDAKDCDDLTKWECLSAWF